MVSILYVVATPLGNLGDITLRALEILRRVDIVACEDTRLTLKLLNHFEISVKVISCRAQNERVVANKIVALLADGLQVAYLSDAGTPALSDPGTILVRAVVEAGHQIVPIPGPSAFACLLSVAGGFDKSVLFEGFLSQKSGKRKTRLQELLALNSAFVIYESPYRILKLLEELADLDNERYVCVGREMTKVHEEFLRGSVQEVLQILQQREIQKGEFSVFVSGKKKNNVVK